MVFIGMRRPQCILWPSCVEVPGCHLTICGGFHCVGKGLVNAYSFYGKAQTLLCLPWTTKGRVKVCWNILIMVREGSVHRFSLPTVVFPWTRLNDIYV